MIICDICTGRHATSVCVTGKQHVAAILTTGTPDDMQPPPAPDAKLALFDARRAAADLALVPRKDRHLVSATERSRQRRARLRLVS